MLFVQPLHPVVLHCTINQSSSPRSRPFGTRLFYPHSKISSDVVACGAWLTVEIAPDVRRQVKSRRQRRSSGVDVAVSGAEPERRRDSGHAVFGARRAPRPVSGGPHHQGTVLPQSEVLSTADARAAERHPRRYRFIYLFIYILHGLYRTLSHSQSEESQVRGGHKSVSENPAVKFSF